MKKGAWYQILDYTEGQEAYFISRKKKKKSYYLSTSGNGPLNSHEAGPIPVTIRHVRKSKHREVKSLAQGHAAIQW